MTSDYPRDLIGYGAAPPRAEWPGGARLALQFVLNYEEGGENSILHGDVASEAFLSETIGAKPWPGQRNMSMESVYEYGSRVGVWRIFALFAEQRIPLTIFAVAMALERHPQVAEAALQAGHEICSHGYRWIDYRDIAEMSNASICRRRSKSSSALLAKGHSAGTPDGPAPIPVAWLPKKAVSYTIQTIIAMIFRFGRRSKTNRI